MNNQVVVAMSGGVDSSVAALLLKQQGYEALGISMQVWDYRNHGGCASRATCCAPDDFTDARRVAATIGIPYYVFDFEDVFREKVINPFIKSYSIGVTPNPCIECNSKVKFASLRSRAESLGCHSVATGHYARISKDADGYHLLRGADELKDQSYFLYRMSQQELAKTLFPVGDLTKSEVRALARDAGLVTAEKPESQDVCFISGETAAFVAKHGGATSPGEIVSTSGEIIGKHDGIHHFTIGQRRGINIGGSTERLYVIDIDNNNSRVVVGPRQALEQESFEITNLTWIAPSILERLQNGYEEAAFDGIAQVRHRHEGCRVSVKINSRSSATVIFKEESTSTAPGQGAVIYDVDNKEVLGGGTIMRGQRVNSLLGRVINEQQHR